MTEETKLKWEIFKELNRTGTALRPVYERDFSAIAQGYGAHPRTSQASQDQLLKDVETVFAALTAKPKAKRSK